MLKFFSGLFDSNEKQLRNIRPIIEQINSLEPELKELSDDQLKAKTDQFRERLGVNLDTARDEEFDKGAQKEKLMEILPEAFAVVREAARRVANHRHFEVQLMAGYFLADNKITELFTGEGKTNAATLPMYLYALTGRGAHLVTVNDYLARRDGEWNGHVLNALGISVGVVNSGQQYKFVSDEEAIAIKGEDAQEAIKERDQKHQNAGRLKLDLMSGVNLVECTKHEAYGCDVVYGTNNEFGFDYLRDNMAQTLADRVQTRLHYAIVDEADSILIDEARTPLIISQSAQASNELYKQFAQIARAMEPNVHYSVDEKSNAVAISDEGIDFVEKQLKVKNVYEDAQFAYHLDNALKAKELYKLDDEYIVREGEVVIVDEFTGRAMPGRRYSEGLHQAIEAKEGVEVKRESKTLATITLQNYFRLYDYLSGMTATALTEAEEFAKVYNLDVVVVPTNKPVVRIDENDVVYRTVEGKFRAIVEDIKEAYEIGQPVLVGTTSVERSEQLSKMLTKEGVPHEVLNAKHHEKEAKIVQNAGQKGQVTIATNMAGRGTDIALGEGVKDLGGLYVIGSERHESRRIDNQLRGRSGRQGDPGRSRFYVSFEDELMRLFGGDRMEAIMGRIGMDDTMPISVGILGRSIENAQKKVESHNFDIRKRLVEYDDVLNQQRDIIYSLRKRILSVIDTYDLQLPEDGAELDQKQLKELDVYALFEDLDGFTLKNKESWDISGMEKFPVANHPIYFWVLKKYIDHVRFLVSAQLVDDMKIDNAEERATVSQIRGILTDELVEESATALGYEDSVQFFKEMDGMGKAEEVEEKLLHLTVAAFLIHIYKIGKQHAPQMTKLLLLQSIDNYWMEHLDGMGDLREGIGMQSIAQRDPLVAYKNEGFALFEKMLRSIDEAVVSRFMKVQVVEQSSIDTERLRTIHSAASQLGGISGGATLPNQLQPGRAGDRRPGDMVKQQTVVNRRPDIGRNDPCPCGSGKKYKKCHLGKEPVNDEERRAFDLYFTNPAEWAEKYSSSR